MKCAHDLVLANASQPYFSSVTESSRVPPYSAQEKCNVYFWEPLTLFPGSGRSHDGVMTIRTHVLLQLWTVSHLHILLLFLPPPC